jgi:hypothetical protein
MLGDFVNYLPGNVQDLSLPGSRAAFQSAPPVLQNYEDFVFPESIGQEAGRFSMQGPLPGRYYGKLDTPPGGVRFGQSPADASIAPNSGQGLSVASTIMGMLSGASPTDVPASADLPQAGVGVPYSVSPNGAVLPGGSTSTNGTSLVGPMTLTTPMPSVLVPRENQVTPSQLQPCDLARWVNQNKLLAVGVAVAVYWLLKGSK